MPFADFGVDGCQQVLVWRRRRGGGFQWRMGSGWKAGCQNCQQPGDELLERHCECVRLHVVFAFLGDCVQTSLLYLLGMEPLHRPQWPAWFTKSAGGQVGENPNTYSMFETAWILYSGRASLDVEKAAQCVCDVSVLSALQSVREWNGAGSPTLISASSWSSQLGIKLSQPSTSTLLRWGVWSCISPEWCTL